MGILCTWFDDKIVGDTGGGSVDGDKLSCAKLYGSADEKLIARGFCETPNMNMDVKHKWEKANNDYVTNIIKSIADWGMGLMNKAGDFMRNHLPSGAAQDRLTSNVMMNVVLSAYPEMFKKYGGTEYGVTIPSMKIVFLPSGDPSSVGFDIKHTPAKKAYDFLCENKFADVDPNDANTIKETKKSDKDKSSDSDSASKKSGDDQKGMLDKYINTFKDAMADVATNLEKNKKLLTNKSIVGDTVYAGNFMLQAAPMGFRKYVSGGRDVNAIKLPGAVHLDVDGVRYPNLLIESVKVTASKNRLYFLGKDYGPAIVTMDISFDMAIQYSRREIDYILKQIACMDYKKLKYGE